jgi:hypothetical protein
MPELDASQTKLLGALTIAACRHLGDETGVIDADGQLQMCRIVRVGDDVALVDIPADDRGPPCINCYSVDVERFDAGGGCKFELDPSPPGLLFAVDAQGPSTRSPSRVGAGRSRAVDQRGRPGLLSALRRWAPHAIDWSGMQDIVPLLDAFKAAMDAKTSRRIELSRAAR